jgi:hypothetical protein
MTNYGFSDLHSFKDFVVFVYLCAPDEFPVRDYRSPEDQWNLELAFQGLRDGLQLTSKEKGELPVLASCRAMVEEAYIHYREGRSRDGCLKLQEMEKLLKKIPSH